MSFHMLLLDDQGKLDDFLFLIFANYVFYKPEFINFWFILDAQCTLIHGSINSSRDDTLISSFFSLTSKLVTVGRLLVTRVSLSFLLYLFPDRNLASRHKWLCHSPSFADASSVSSITGSSWSVMLPELLSKTIRLREVERDHSG